MVKERNYLIETLKSSGIKSQVYTNMKKLKAGNEVHVGAVLRNGETFARSGSKKTYIDQEGQRKRRGYENAKVMIDILLEDTKTATTLEQLTEMQRLFKPYGQDKPKLLPIVNEDCAVRGITKVYFKNLTSKKVISESKRIASLELWAPDIAGIKVKRRPQRKDY